MVHQHNLPPTTMGQAGLCSVTTPQTDSFSPFNSGVDGAQQSQQSNGIPSDIMATLSLLLANRSDINTDSLLLKLQSVVNENFELKDTIAQNNLALRQQMNLLVQWTQQVEQEQRHYKQEINEYTKKLSLAEQENSLLKSALSGFKNPNSSSPKFEELSARIESLNQQLESSEREVETAFQEKESLCSQKSKLEGELTLLKCDLTATKSEFERLHLQKQELLCTVKELRNKLQSNERQTKGSPAAGGSSASPQRVQAHQQELQDTRNQVEYLEAELKISRDETSKYKSKYQMSSQEMASSPLSTSDKKDEFEIRRLREEAQMLREEVDTLEGALSAERKRTNEERTTLNRLQGENLRLKKDLTDSRDRSEKSQYNDQYYQAKIKSVQEQHDEATAKLISYEELLGSKNDEIGRMKREVGQTKAQLTELKSERDTIAVLRAQVEVYQSDFRAEREAREAMAADREKLREDMRHLQMRNTHLMDELESYQRRHFNQGRSPRSGSEEPNANGAGAKDPKDSSLSPESIWEKLSSGSDKKGEEPKKEETVEVDENLLYCPKCNKTFTELRPLEEHVNRCLDED